MDHVPGMRQNGAAPQPQVIPINPLVLELNSCKFGVQHDIDAEGNPLVHLHFVHMSNVVGFHTVLSGEARDELVRQLTGGIAIPRVQLPGT